MKYFKISLIFLLIINHTICFSQEVKMSKEVEKILQLGKDSIIQLGLKLIDKEVSLESFSQIKITTNGEEVFVLYKNPIKYLPIKSKFYFDIGVRILASTTSINSVSNPVNYPDKTIIPFYTQTKKMKKSIQFVIESINKSSGTDSPLDITNFEDEMIIRENENYYDILVLSKYQESSYKIEKVSGKIYDDQHAHLEPPPDGLNEKAIIEVF